MTDNRKYWIIIMISVINSVVVIFLVIQHWSEKAETPFNSTVIKQQQSNTEPSTSASNDASASSTERYLARLAIADSLYLAGDYAEARTIYLEANDISNLYSYPLDKVKLIDTLLSIAKDTDSVLLAVQNIENQSEYNTIQKPATSTSLNYHIVVGIFEDPARADNIIRLIGKHGKTAILKPYKKSGLTAVIYDSFPTLEEANQQLPIVKQQISPDAWILRATFGD